jgi:ribonuclease III family protein
MNSDECRLLNPLVLAFAGDAIYEVMVREYLINNNREMLVHKLHKEAVSFVKAHAQSEFMKQLRDELTEEEFAIYKRGRNAKSGTVPKNADVQEYREATGFEAVFGFLYLTGQNERLNNMFKKIISISEKDDDNATQG